MKKHAWNQPNKGRRDFCKMIVGAVSFLLIPGAITLALSKEEYRKWYGGKYNPLEHRYGMGINVDRCIGCGRCVDGCKKENKTPPEPFFFRTWIERYIVTESGATAVDSPNGGRDGFRDQAQEKNVLKTFFVPKICNQCDNPPCVQVCPVGATYKTADGVILVDEKYCIGCRYCIHACPYGMRFLNPVTKTADKCTFCYHRIIKGMAPVCVEVCPTQARVFGDLSKIASPLNRFVRINKVMVIKPNLNTDPKVFYANLDKEVS